MLIEPVTDNSISNILGKERKEEKVKKFCESCSPNSAVDFELKPEIVSTSDVVLVTLKRFETDFFTGIAEKIRTPVDPSLKVTIEGQKYLLKAVIQHVGETIS